MGSKDISGAIKTWLFPSVVTLIATLIWRDMQEMRQDIKALLAQSNIDKTRIDNMERQIDLLNNKVLLNSNKTAYFEEHKKDGEDPDKREGFGSYREMVVSNNERKKAVIQLKRKTNDFAI